MPTYEEVIAKLSPEEVTILDEHNKGLLNSVKATREERDALSIELKKLAKQVDPESDAGKRVGELQSKLAKETRRANFYELAVKQGVKNSKAAFALANSEGLFLEDSNPDWDRLRETAPELFAIQNISSDAGSGTNQKPVADSNKAIKDALQNTGTVTIKSRR